MSLTDRQMQELARAFDDIVAAEAHMNTLVATGEMDAAVVEWFGQTYAGQFLASMRDLCSRTAEVVAEMERLGIHIEVID
jgi:hypothetical protein